MSKYRSEKCVIDGITFDSLFEGSRYRELQLLERAGKISDLEVHKQFVLIKKSRWGRTISYEADFVYFDREKNGYVVEDTKSSYTQKLPVYRLKKRLFQELYDMDITEIIK